MPEGLVSMQDQFSGLDMAALVGGPLKAACDAQMMLANSTARFIAVSYTHLDVYKRQGQYTRRNQ